MSQHSVPTAEIRAPLFASVGQPQSVPLQADLDS